MDTQPKLEERLALAEVEARLRRIRNRFNLYAVQHRCYSFGTALALGIVILTVCTFTLSPFLFACIAWPLLALLVGILVFSLRRVVAGWANLQITARRVDAKADCKDRLATLAAQLRARTQGLLIPSRLWPHLLEENATHMVDWEMKKVAPRRVPWSIFSCVSAWIVALAVISVPLLTSSSEPMPFSLANLQTLFAEFPERASTAIERQLSLRPEPQTAWQGQIDVTGKFVDQTDPTGETGGKKDGGLLAALSEGLQDAIRRALGRLPDSDGGSGPNQREQRLVLRRDKVGGEADFFMEGQLPEGAEPYLMEERREQRNRSGAGQMPLAQGGGIQQLGRARLDRKQTRGGFEPSDSPAQGRGGQSGTGGGGTGAGSGTDPRLLGNRADVDGAAPTFQLALNARYQKGRGGVIETEDENGGADSKSRKELNQRQSLDDAIRKAQIPPEYEDIVKHLFSLGGSP